MASSNSKLLLQLLLLLVAAVMSMGLYGNSFVMLALAAPDEPVAYAPPPPVFDIEVDGDDVDESLRPVVADDDDNDYDDMDELQFEVDCETVNPFPAEAFDDQSDVTKVYLEPSILPESIFTKVGFEKFITVFGIPIIGTSKVSSDILEHAGLLFAKFLDNDEDGIVDDPESVGIMRKYRTIVGYVKGGEESNDLWVLRLRDPENSEFRKQFSCNMQFFEQWADDATPELHKVPIGNDDEDLCERRSKLPFDWPLWYFPFITTYYGYLETFDDNTVSVIQAKMEKAEEVGLFTGKYQDDLDMEMSDFFAWSLLTTLGSLKCHCDSDVHAWNVCTIEKLEEFDGEWVQFLRNMKNIPHSLPDGEYNSSAVFSA